MILLNKIYKGTEETHLTGPGSLNFSGKQNESTELKKGLPEFNFREVLDEFNLQRRDLANDSLIIQNIFIKRINKHYDSEGIKLPNDDYKYKIALGAALVTDYLFKHLGIINSEKGGDKSSLFKTYVDANQHAIDQHSKPAFEVLVKGDYDVFIKGSELYLCLKGKGKSEYLRLTDLDNNNAKAHEVWEKDFTTQSPIEAGENYDVKYLIEDGSVVCQPKTIKVSDKKVIPPNKTGIYSKQLSALSKLKEYLQRESIPLCTALYEEIFQREGMITDHKNTLELKFGKAYVKAGLKFDKRMKIKEDFHNGIQALIDIKNNPASLEKENSAPIIVKMLIALRKTPEAKKNKFVMDFINFWLAKIALELLSGPGKAEANKSFEKELIEAIKLIEDGISLSELETDPGRVVAQSIQKFNSLIKQEDWREVDFVVAAAAGILCWGILSKKSKEEYQEKYEEPLENEVELRKVEINELLAEQYRYYKQKPA